MTTDIPAPSISAYNKPYWESAAQHELRLQQCGDCARFWAPPGPVCPHCFSGNYSWERVAGTGVITSRVRFHKAYHPAFADSVPFTVAFVELTEGPRLITNIRCAPDTALTAGTPVEVFFEDYQGFSLPQFRPTGA